MRRVLLLFIMGIIFLSGCSDQPPSSKGGSFESLKIVNNGAVYPQPIRSTTTVMSSGSISFKSEKIDLVSETVLETVGSWTNELSATDLEALDNLIVAANLSNQGDVNLPDGVEPCVGGANWDVDYVSKSNVPNSFLISGGILCQPDLIPSDLNSVLKKISEFETTYGAAVN